MIINIEIKITGNLPFDEFYKEIKNTFREDKLTQEFWFEILSLYIKGLSNIRYRPVLLQRLADETDVVAWFNSYMQVVNEFVDEEELLTTLLS